MPRALTTDDYYNDVRETFELFDDPTFAEQVIAEATSEDKSELWGMIREGDYEAVVGHMWLFDYDIPNDIFDAFLAQEFEDEEPVPDEVPDTFIPDEPHTDDRLFNTGAEFTGSLQIVESENDKVYVPSSYYCHTKVFNKFLDLQGRGDDIIPLEGKGINPYAMSKTSFLNHMMKYMFKCDCACINGEKKCKSKCAIDKRKKYEDKKTGNDFYRNESTTTPADPTNDANFCKPSICRVWWDGKKVQIKPINKAAQSHPYMCVGLISLVGTGNCHAILIKDYHNVTMDDLVIHLTKTKELFPGFKKFQSYTYRDPKPYAVSWDIETWVHSQLNKCTTCRRKEKMESEGKVSRSQKPCTCKYSYKLNVAAIGYEIINVVKREIIKPCEIVFDWRIAEDDESSLFDQFFLKLHEDCKSLEIDDVTLFAHNGGKFDNIFAKKSKVVKFVDEISVGNNIKSLKLLVNKNEFKLKISLKDTLPFTLQPLKDACETFKTEICKEEFDIINKSRKWYCMNRDPEIHRITINNKDRINQYITDYMDMHMKCNYNIIITTTGDGQFRCDPKFAQQGKEAKMKELEDIKTYKDWKKYLSFDVRSLSNLIFNVDAMYNDLGFSITNYLGLPGVAMDMMNSYCYNLSKLYVPSDPSMVELCKASIKGGRVLHFKDKWDSPLKEGVRWDDDKKEFVNKMNEVIKDDIYDDYLISIDMNSLYPSMMYAAGYPVGHPELVTKAMLEDKTWLDKPHFIGEFEVIIPNIRYAIHPYKSEKGALLYPSNQTIIDVYNDVDIREMIKDGYTVKMLKGIYWNKSAKIFSEYIEMLYNKRLYHKSLNPDDPEYAKEYLFKICLNAGFGKFNETIRSLVRFFTGDEEEMVKSINKKSRVTKMANNQYRINETLKVPRVGKPTYIAGYITAYSRALVNELFRKLGPENVFCSDTDSLYIRYSDFNKAKLACSNGLCGFKNDYGDGVMITKARFLDIKRYYLEFRSKVDHECKDKWGKHRLSCKDPITKKVNTGDPYYVKTFKFKYTGINFRDIVSSSALEPDNKLYSTEKSHEAYNKIMENTVKIVDKFIQNNTNNKDKKPKDYENLQFMMKRFKKNGHSVTINVSEFSFSVTKEKRGQWITNEDRSQEYYALGYDKDKPEVFLTKNCKIRDLVKKFSHLTKCNYGLAVDKCEKYLRSRRPLFYNTRMHFEVIKEHAARYPIRIPSNNEYILNHNKSTNKPEYLQKMFDEYIKYSDNVKNGVIKLDPIVNGKYTQFLSLVVKYYLDFRGKVDKNPWINRMVNNDVIYDKKREFCTDYYIEFFDEIPENVKHADNGVKYRILSKLIKYGKNGKESEYFIPNFINVKSRAEDIDGTKLYPVLMLSTRFNAELGFNNLLNWQALSIMKNTEK